MKSIRSEENARILIVGPLPPPIGGSPLTVQAMMDELSRYPSIEVTLINTSPLRDVRKKMTGFNFEKVRRMIFVLTHYFHDIRGSSVVLVFANDLFAFILVPVLLFLARIYHKPFYIKPVGGGLDLYLANQNRIFREYLLNVLRSADGVLAQTQLLQAALIKLGCSKTYYLPGCRPLHPLIRVPKQNQDELRLIFLGHITREKGPLILLEALQIVAGQCSTRVSCDFYGPIHDEIRAEFLSQMEITPNVLYCGVAEAGTGSQLISEHDALVLPTSFDTEGHPGVLIEAMHAGVPIISTQIRTIPELVTQGENGLLVPVRNSSALAEAIKQIALDRPLREKMGQTNYLRGYEFRSDVVVAQMLNIMLP
jgi:glycosyltransferase involved in cell wall biosynthesis